MTLRDDDRARPGGADLRPQPLAAASRPQPWRRAALSRVRSASASIRRSATRSRAICRASVGSICVATPFEGRTVSCGRVPAGAAARATAASGRAGMPASTSTAGEHGRAGERRGTEPVAARPRERALQARRQHVDQRPCRADDPERTEQRDLRPELRHLGRDQQHREQGDGERVDPAADPALRRRLRVGDHEEEEDHHLGREHDHAPELEAGDRAEMPAGRHLMAGRGDHARCRSRRRPRT